MHWAWRKDLGRVELIRTQVGSRVGNLGTDLAFDPLQYFALIHDTLAWQLQEAGSAGFSLLRLPGIHFGPIPIF